jgi:hypothetical protein
MLVVNKRSFYTGLVMSVGFAAILVFMFLPVVNGRTPLDAADDLFNSVAKQSSYYIPALREHAKTYAGAPIDMRLTLPDAEAAAQVTAVLKAGGAEASTSGTAVTLRGNLGRLLGAALDDADASFTNRAKTAASSHGLGAKEAMFAWWQALKQINKKLKAASDFEKASAVEEVITKGVEVSYNFYGIVPKAVSANTGILSVALIFYLIYTMWWGYAIMWLCDGIGLEMKASSKREH